MEKVLFHLAFPVSDLALTRTYYVDGLGCEAGRESPASLILNLCGHQLVAQHTDEPLTPQKGIYPRHFGIIFTDEQDFEVLLGRARDRQLHFHVEPKRRFAGLVTEHRSFFLEDPFYNFLEFKFYTHPEAIFGALEFKRIGDRQEATV